MNIDKENLGNLVNKLREEKNISQQHLCEFLQIPRSAVSQIENGARDVSFSEFNNILEIFCISYEEFMDLLKPLEERKTVNPSNKKIEFNAEKFKQLFLYILEKCGSKPNVGETVLYKLLYFCDFDFFEIYEKPLSGMKYKKLQFGPVPIQSNFNQTINEMIEQNIIQKFNKPYIGDTVQTRYIGFQKADITQFEMKEIEVINKVISRLSDMSARQIEDHVHRDYPWQSHDFGDEISYESVFNRIGEFAQRDYDEEFLQTALQDSFGSLTSLTEQEYNYYMSLPDKKDD